MYVSFIYTLNVQNVMCRSYTWHTSTPYTWTQYIFKLHCTQSLYNKIHVEYSNVTLSSRNISYNSSSSHTCTWHKHSKCHTESVRFLEIDLGHVTHFSSLGTVESQTLCDRIWLVNSIRGDMQDAINQSKFYLKSVHFITIQHKLSRAFQTDMHNKIT